MLSPWTRNFTTHNLSIQGPVSENFPSHFGLEKLFRCPIVLFSFLDGGIGAELSSGVYRNRLQAYKCTGEQILRVTLQWTIIPSWNAVVMLLDASCNRNWNKIRLYRPNRPEMRLFSENLLPFFLDRMIQRILSLQANVDRKYKWTSLYFSTPYLS